MQSVLISVDKTNGLPRHSFSINFGLSLLETVVVRLVNINIDSIIYDIILVL